MNVIIIDNILIDGESFQLGRTFTSDKYLIKKIIEGDKFNSLQKNAFHMAYANENFRCQFRRNIWYKAVIYSVLKNKLIYCRVTYIRTIFFR